MLGHDVKTQCWPGTRQQLSGSLLLCSVLLGGSSVLFHFLQIAFSDHSATARTTQSSPCPSKGLSETCKEISLLLTVLFSIYSGIHLVPQQPA